MQATFNQVSDCCHRSIVFKYGREFPLGGVTWGISTKEPVCESCGKDCGEVDQCEVCGVVGCLGDCIVDISEDEKKR